MAKISDDSDNQRIREMQETELRNRVDQQKKDSESRISKAFSDVMKEKSQKQQGEKLSKMDAQKGAEKKLAEERSVLNSVLKKTPQQAAEHARRAAISNAMQSGLSKTQKKNAEDTSKAQSTRVEDMTSKSRDEKEIVDKDVREHDADDLRRGEEKEVEQKQMRAENELRGELARTDADGRRRSGGGDGGESKDQGERKPQSVQAAAQPKSAHVPRISQELIDQIVSAIHTAHVADGRTEIHVDLKGSMLEGIRLKVHAQGGKVRCTFEGCDKEMKALLESSKGALMRGLSKRGMTLTAMDVR